MLPKKYRLSEKKEISRTFRDGRKIHGKCFLLTFSSNNFTVSRFSILCGKMVFSLASERNYVKRLVREALCQILPRIQSGYDGVFVFMRKPEKTLNFKEVFAEIEALLFRAHLLM